MENKSAMWQHAAHALAWLGGGLIALTPFVQSWSISLGFSMFPVRVWPGNCIVEWITATVLVAVGGCCGGYCWHQHLGGRRGPFFLLAWGLAGWLGWLAQPVFWLGTTALFTVAGGAALRCGWHNWRTQTRATAEVWNGVLCGLILVLAVASDCIMLEQVKGGTSAVVGFVLARGLTQVVIVALAWFGLLQFVRYSPPATRWLGGLALGLAVVALGAEIGMRKLWGKGLVLFFGELTVGGKFDLLRVLEGGGIRFTLPGFLGGAGVVALVCGVVLGTAQVSRRLDLRLRSSSLLVVALGAWLLLLVEQGSETLWNGRVGRWWQRRCCMIHLCPGVIAPGLASYNVLFREPTRPPSLTITRRPDVYWFIVETLRGDGARPEIMPFVSQWRDTECQPISETRAAANATHLSWYAMLSGKPPVFWEIDRQAQRPAPLLEALHAAGYRNEVRSSAIFNYAGMDTTNFGHGEATDVLLSLTPESHEWPEGISERDLHVMDLWRDAVLTRPAGGTFRLVAVESPHYPYNWTSDFTPPFADFAQSSWFPLHPSPLDIAQVKHRYWNSLAWVDGLLAQYIGFLKAHDRYDDALIIVTGDHGEEMQEHGVWFHTSGLTTEQTSVPIIVKWPKMLGRGQPLALASHLDLMPSILDALGCPQSQWDGLAGHSLRQPGNPTTLVMSHYASQNGEGMLWRRNGFEAAFAWEKIWVPGQPSHIWLERITGPHGNLPLDTPAAATAALHEYFPDAIPRWFNKFE
ncbi:MAG: sulfatase-like hydrolase/transferase [Verrucomicrobiota bacterium]